MKRLALTVAAAAFAWLGTTTESSASPYCGSRSSVYISTYTRCGCPVYVQRYIAYYDHCGRPVWQTRTMPVNHQCRPVYRPSRCQEYRYRGCNPGGYYGSRGNCNGPFAGGNVVFQARW